MKILLLEDDESTSAHIVRTLNAAGHTVDTCTNGQDALFLAGSGTHTVLIFDRMVKGVDGLSTLKALRVMGVRTPALFLTAMDGVMDRVEGLEAGGDDYLIKPFATVELLARVNALARRAPIAEVNHVLRVADLELDRMRRAVCRAGRRVELQPQEYKLLEFLMLHAGQMVTRAMLLESVWSFHFDPGTNIIESHMSRLRGKVDRGFDQELIQTVRGVGYRLDA
ncbi:MAG: response regulator transcription factor [Sphingomonadales bacterium]|nr:response regulator transcription factor [Sphingomonadales bacterium]MDE2172098.1 response regulator transcription factor [Sphingomonadales bacterium]